MIDRIIPTNFPKIDSKFEPFISEMTEREHIKKIKLMFPNGFGASIIHGYGTYGFEEGLFELAVLNFGNLCYDTELTDDVIGYLDDAQVNEYLEKIMNLDRGKYEKKKVKSKD